MNRKLWLGLLTLLAFGWIAESAMAQFWYRPPVYPYGPYPNYGSAYYGGGYSPVEGAQRGFADVIRSSGEAAESFSRARINNEEARSRYLDNKLKWTEVYWQRKRLGEAELAKDHAKDRERRDNWLEYKRRRQPDTLTTSQFDPQTGQIEWPAVLQGELFAEYRERIETELQQQATSGADSNSANVRNLARQMQGLLKDQIHDLPANDYIAARNFLDRLVNQMVLSQRPTT